MVLPLPPFVGEQDGMIQSVVEPAPESGQQEQEVERGMEMETVAWQPELEQAVRALHEVVGWIV